MHISGVEGTQLSKCVARIHPDDVFQKVAGGLLWWHCKYGDLRFVQLDKNFAKQHKASHMQSSMRFLVIEADTDDD